MRHARALAIVLALLPFTAAAQMIVPEAPSSVLRRQLIDDLIGDASPESPSRIVPLWSTPDGRILAAVALSAPTPSPLASAAPHVGTALDWRLIDATDLLGGKLDVGLGSNVRIGASLGVGPLLLSDPALPMASCFGAPSAALQSLDCRVADSRVVGHSYSGTVGVDWSDGPLSVGFDLGLNWLDPALPNSLVPALTNVLPNVAVGANALPTLVIPGNDLSRVESAANIGALGRFSFSQDQVFDLSASFGRVTLIPDPDGGRRSYNQTALRLGVGTETLVGNITGRIYRPLSAQGLAPGAHRWTGVDLGVTWHTPWQGNLSIGAQNLWTSPPTVGEDAETQARVPYVQYHQDL
jgi:hypothetical protein